MENNDENRSVGPVTAASTTGATVGAALAAVLVLLVPALQPVEWALTILATAALGLLGGWLVKPGSGRRRG